jgi:hypothetical protein
MRVKMPSRKSDGAVWLNAGERTWLGDGGGSTMKYQRNEAVITVTRLTDIVV